MQAMGAENRAGTGAAWPRWAQGVCRGLLVGVVLGTMGWSGAVRAEGTQGVAPAAAAAGAVDQAGVIGDAPAEASKKRRSVLLVGSYEYPSLSSTHQLREVQNAIELAFPRVSMQIAYLIPTELRGRLESDALRADLGRSFRSRFGTFQPELVVVADTLAFRVLTEETPDLFAGTPMVFTGVLQNRIAEGALAVRPSTGIFEEIDVPGTVDLIRQMQPSLKRVLLISQGSDIAVELRRMAEAQLRDYGAPIEFAWAKSTTMRAIREEVHALGPDEAALLLSFIEPGVQIDLDTVLREPWRVPLYTVYGSALNWNQQDLRTPEHGALGGRVLRYEKLGREAGELAVRVLRGEDPASIPPRQRGGLLSAVDHRHATRLGLSVDHLPASVTVLNRPPAFMEGLWLYVLLGTALIVAQGVIIALLVRNHRSMKRLRLESQARTAELETVLDAVPVAVWIARDPACLVIEGNRVGRELLGQDERVNLSLSAPSSERVAGFAIYIGGKEVAAEDLPVQLAAATGVAVRECEEELVFGDGRRVSLLGNAVPLRDSSGKVTGAVGAFMDVTQRERAVRELRRNQVILEQAQELGEIGSWVSDPAHHDGKLEWSRETYRIFGLREGEFDGSVDTFFSLVHTDDRERVRQASLDAIAGRSEYTIEHRIVRPNGEERWVHERSRVERNEHGEALRMIGVCQDITERMASERALRESEARLRAAMDAAAMIGWETDMATQMTTYSEDPAPFFGLEASAAPSLRNQGPLVIHPDDREQVWKRYFDAVAADESVFEATFRSDSSEVRWFRATARVERDVEGKPVRTMGVTQEVTATVEAEQRVRVSEERYRTIVETCQEGVWLVGADWKTTFVNKRLAEIVGRTPEEMIGRGVLEFMGEDERERTVGHMREREAGLAEQLEYRFVRPDGREVWALFVTNPITDEHGAFAGALAMVTDITERKMAELAIQREQRLFVGGPVVVFRWRNAPGWPVEFVSANVRQFGYSAEDLTSGRVPYVQLVHPDDLHRVGAEVEEHSASGATSFEQWYRVLTADGRVRSLYDFTSVVRNEAGEVTHYEGYVLDVTDRELAQLMLHASEERYRKLFDALPDPAWDWDIKADRTTQSATWTTLLGFAPDASEEEIGDWEALLHPEDRESVLARLHACLKGRAAEYEAEYRIRCRDGSYKWVLSRGRVVERDADGRALRMVGGITDMTERRQAEEELRRRDALLRKLSEQVPGAIYQYLQAADGRASFPYVSEGVRAIFEESPAALRKSADPAYSRIHPDDLPRVVESVERSHATMNLWRCEYRVVLPERGVRWIEGHSKPERLADGGTLWHGHLVDVTERHEVDEALRESETKYRMVLRATSDALWDYEPTSGLLKWGDNVETMFGVKIVEMGDQLEGWAARIHPDDRQRTTESFDAAVDRGDERWMEEYRFRKGDGTYATVLDRAYVVRDSTGTVVRIIGAMSDITERRFNEQMMRGQARTLELLVGGVAVEGVLAELVKILEEIEPGCLGSVLLLDQETRRVRVAAAPSLPDEYSAAIDGAMIGPSAGSCGTAMHRAERVIARDIATDELWKDYKHLALAHGLRACWSEPVIGSGGRVLGSLAMYYTESRGPGEHELRTIAWAARLAGLAIERRRAEQQLRRRENDLRDLLNAVPDLMFRMDREGRYLEYHAPNLAELATPPEQFMGRTVREALPPERAAQCMAAIEQVLATGVTQSYEYQVTNELGLRHWEVRVTPCAEEQVLMLVRDVTKRRVAEQRLRESEQRLSLLVRQSPLGVIVWDLQFRVAEWNAAAEHIFGWAAGEVLGKHAEFILPASVKAQVEDVWKALKANRGGTRSTNANVARDGRTIYCEWYNAPLINADGEVFAVASIVDDVTEERMAQQRQQLMMAELDHRVKNNLAAVISLAEQSGRATTTFAEFRESFLGRVRALSRLHNALAATRWQGANLGTMVRQTLEAFGQDATSQAVVDGPSVVLPARAAQAMGMALNELCTNAIKYGALSVPGGRIEVRWAIRPGEGGEGGSAAPVLELAWVERGGPKVRVPTRRGFGTELIEGAISYELGGSAVLRFAPEGLVCQIRIEMPEEAEFDEREMKPGSLHDQDG